MSLTPKVVLDKKHFVDEPSVVVFKEGNNVYALNTVTKAIIAKDIDAGKVIQSAKDAAPWGGLIFFKAGEYNIYSKLVINRRLRLCGESQAGVFLYNRLASADYILTFTGDSMFSTVENLRFDGTSAKNGYGVKVDANRISIRDCVFNNLINGVTVIGETQGVTKATIKRCTFWTDQPIRIRPGSEWATATLIERCYISPLIAEYGVIAGVDDLSAPGSCSSIRIKECVFEGTGSQNGLKIGEKAFWSWVVDNRFEGLNVGIYGVRAQETIFRDNVFSSVTTPKTGTFRNCVWINNRDWLADAIAYRLQEIPTNAGWGSVVVGSGAVTQNPSQLTLSTGTTANSLAKVHAYLLGLNPVSTSLGNIDWSKEFELSFRLGRYNSDPECVARVQLKPTTDEGVLAGKGVGVEIDNYDIYAEVYGTARNTHLMGALSDNRIASVKIAHIPGWGVDFYLNNTQKIMFTGNSDVPSGVSAAILVVSIKNGSTGDVNASLYITDLKIKYEL